MLGYSYSEELKEFARENPLVSVVILVFLGNLAYIFTFPAGQTLWAALASFQLSLESSSASGIVQDVSSEEVASGPASFERVYMTTILHNGSERTFHTTEPIAADRESVPVRVLPRSPNVFVPDLENQDYWSRVQLLANVSIVKGLGYVVVHLLLSVIVMATLALVIGWLALRYFLPAMADFCVRQDENFASLKSRLTPYLERLRGVLFILLYILLFGLVFLEITRGYLDLALHAEEQTAWIAAGFLCIGVPLLVGIFFLLRSIRRQELLPNLQSTLASVLGLTILSRVAYSSADGFYAVLTGSQNSLHPLLREIGRQLIGF